jgi:hypothetical protein
MGTGRIACDRNEEEECLALAVMKTTTAPDGRFEAAMRL